MCKIFPKKSSLFYVSELSFLSVLIVPTQTSIISRNLNLFLLLAMAIEVNVWNINVHSFSFISNGNLFRYLSLCFDLFPSIHGLLGKHN